MKPELYWSTLPDILITQLINILYVPAFSPNCSTLIIFFLFFLYLGAFFTHLAAKSRWLLSISVYSQVFLAECTGPLIIYLMFYFRLPFIYSPKYDFTSSKHWVVQWVSACFWFWVTLLQHLMVQSRICIDNPFHKYLGSAPVWCRIKPNDPQDQCYMCCKYMCNFCSLACMCHSFHYVKRILETVFVHRISHGTMPLRNIFKVNEMLKPGV